MFIPGILKQKLKLILMTKIMIIDWSIYDDYQYSKGDGLYLDEKSLYEGKIVTTDHKQPFVNTKHPLGNHIINRSSHEYIRKSHSNTDTKCRQCHEYKLSTSTFHEGMETIPLCNSCFNDDYK